MAHSATASGKTSEAKVTTAGAQGILPLTIQTFGAWLARSAPLGRVSVLTNRRIGRRSAEVQAKSLWRALLRRLRLDSSPANARGRTAGFKTGG